MGSKEEIRKVCDKNSVPLYARNPARKMHLFPEIISRNNEIARTNEIRKAQDFLPNLHKIPFALNAKSYRNYIEISFNFYSKTELP